MGYSPSLPPSPSPPFPLSSPLPLPPSPPLPSPSPHSQSGKPGGVLHIWQCVAMFDPKTKGLSHSYCFGLELKEYTTYLKADSAAVFNEWLKVRKISKAEPERFYTNML